jgi:RNA polymerase sigma factor (sigma-70 family)
MTSNDEPVAADSANAAIIRAAVTEHYDQMLRSVWVHVSKTESHPRPPKEMEELAVEILDEAVLEALKNAEDFDPTRSVRAWIQGIAARVLHKRHRQEARARRCLPATDMGQNGWTAWLERLRTGPADAATADRLDLEQALTRISASHCWIIKFHYCQGRSIEELSERLGVATLGAARVRLCRALSALRAQLLHPEEGVLPC